MTCARFADLDFVERYVLGQMDEAEQASFEAHFFECPDCFAAVQAMQAAQSALREPAEQPGTVSQPSVSQPPATTASRVVDFSAHAARVKNGHSAGSGKSVGPRILASGATWIGVAAAASLAGLMIWTPWRAKAPGSARGSNSSPTATIAQQRAPGTAPGGGQAQTPARPDQTPQTPERSAQTTGASQTPGAAQTPGATEAQSGRGAATKPNQSSTPGRTPISLDTLALIAPPPYVPLQTRGGESASAAAFAEAMNKYTAKDYRGAIDALKPLADAQPPDEQRSAQRDGRDGQSTAVPAGFFLGVSYLAAGDAPAATAALDRVAASGVAPFNDEAHFYLAKAALRAHDLHRAERELSAAVDRQAGPPNEAARLLQEVRLYRREHGRN